MIKRPVTSLNHRSSERNIKSAQNTKLPNLSDIMNLKLRQQPEGELQLMIQSLVKQVQTLNTAVTQKDKQILQYEFMIKSLQIAIEKRDCIISALRVERQQQESVPINKGMIKSEESSRVNPASSKRIARARTKENSMDESLQTIIQMDLKQMTQYLRYYEELNHLSAIKNLIQNEDVFVQNIQKLDFSGIVNIFDALMLLLAEHKSLFLNVVKTNKLVDCSLKINETTPLNDQLEQFGVLIKESLECDKALIYVLDNEHQEMWTKTKDRVQRINVGEDIVGACYQERKQLNIHNAYNDPRFKKDQDKGYKTTTLLLNPILDKQQNPIGVVQAINKLGGHFTNEDQMYIVKFSNVMSILLRNQQQSSESISIQNSLRNLLQSHFAIAYLNQLETILYEAENQLMNLFHTQKGYIYIINNKRYARVNDKNSIEEFQQYIGIIGEAHKQQDFVWVPNAYNHQSFNSLVDISTTMPVYCLYIQSQKNAIIIQVINTKGIRAQKVNSMDQELLQMFGKIVLSRIDCIQISYSQQ